MACTLTVRAPLEVEIAVAAGDAVLRIDAVPCTLEEGLVEELA